MRKKGGVRKAKDRGFTLVELAIVMVIIGLLIGGILKGQELIYNARLTATISQVKGYSAAINVFQDKYNAKPGDMLKARTVLPNCTVGTNCYNGSGDTMIGTPTVAWTNNALAINAENIQFWKHLALADLITGVETTTGTVAAGFSNPSSKLRGFFDVAQITSNDPTDPASLTGAYFRMLSCATCTDLENPMGQQAASPLDAGYIDRKMDDGSPGSGAVRTSSLGQHSAAGGCEDTYGNTTVTRCVMYFKASN